MCIASFQPHLLFAPTDIVKTLKSVSTIAIFTQFPQLKGQKILGVRIVVEKLLCRNCWGYERKGCAKLYCEAKITLSISLCGAIHPRAQGREVFLRLLVIKKLNQPMESLFLNYTPPSRTASNLDIEGKCDDHNHQVPQSSM